MRSHWPTIYFAAMAVVAFGFSCWGTRVLLRQPDVPTVQRRWQLVLTWVVPVVGALLVIEMYRSSRRRIPSRFVTADEIHPMVNRRCSLLPTELRRVGGVSDRQRLL